jgi:hypothetical protein
VLSSSVRDVAKNGVRPEPKRSTNFRARFGPSPGVIVSAAHSSKCEAVGERATALSMWKSCLKSNV